jgi:hypothetical protein
MKTLTITYEVDEYTRPNDNNENCLYKNWKNITFNFGNYEDNKYTTKAINKIRKILDECDDDVNKINSIKNLIDAIPKNYYYFDDGEMNFKIPYFDEPSKLYIQIKEETDHRGYNNFYGTYFYTVPSVVACRRCGIELSYNNPLKKYVYDHEDSTYKNTKDIYYDRIQKH